MNIYETTTLLEAVKLSKPVHTFLRDAFFPHSLDRTFPTDSIVIDSKRGKRKMAPFVAPRVGGATVDREGYETTMIYAPKIAPQRTITVDDLSTRGMGESIISDKTPQDREAELIGNDMHELSEMIDRREEWMLRELLFTGKIGIKGYIDHADSKTVDQVISFGDKAPIAPKVKWNAATNSDIEGDLRQWRRDIIQKTGKAPTILVVGSDVVTAMLNNEKLMKMLDIKNMNIGNINPVIQNDATTYLGRFTSLGLDVYSYDEWYLDDNGEENPMVPSDTVLLANRAMGSVKYAVITQLEKGQYTSYEAAKVPKAWADDGNDRKMIKITSRPLPVPFDVESWSVAKVV